jgi:glutamate-1-semialdehyde 2,1-aminomutase
MKRYREERPADICFARGTFNAHPYVMAAMAAFIRRLREPTQHALYEGLDARWNERASAFNARFEREGLPCRVANLSSIWTMTYTVPSRYNWMYQFYLRAEGIGLSWVGTGRFIFSLNYTDADVQEVLERFVSAGQRMQAHGWWREEPGLTDRAIRRSLLREMLGRLRPGV